MRRAGRGGRAARCGAGRDRSPPPEGGGGRLGRGRPSGSDRRWNRWPPRRPTPRRRRCTGRRGRRARARAGAHGRCRGRAPTPPGARPGAGPPRRPGPPPRGETGRCRANEAGSGPGCRRRPARPPCAAPRGTGAEAAGARRCRTTPARRRRDGTRPAPPGHRARGPPARTAPGRPPCRSDRRRWCARNGPCVRA